MIKREQRQVQRDVQVYCCNRCGAEHVDEHVGEWLHLCRLVVQSVQTAYGTVEKVMTGRPGSEQHLCPRCADLVVAAVAHQPSSSAAGLIPVRTTTGETVLLTRYEWERWAAAGRPPILSAGQVKA